MVAWHHKTPEVAWANVHMEVSSTLHAAVTDYYRVGGLNNQHLFLTVMKA